MAIGLWVMTGVSILLLRGLVALYLSGLARTKNAAAALFRALAETCTAILAFWAIGIPIFFHGAFKSGSTAPGNGAVFFLNTAICVLAVGLALAPTLGRSRLIVSVAGAILIGGLFLPFSMWISPLPWLFRNGFNDVAGSCSLFFPAGCMGLIAATMLGPRAGKYNRDGSTNVLLGHSVTLASAAVIFIFIFWIPFLMGCQFVTLGGDTQITAAATNTMLAGAAAGGAAMLYSLFRYRKQDIFLVYCGILGGLVAISAPAGNVIPIWAALIGAVAGILVPILEVQMDLFWKIDDPSSLVAVCIGGGAWGTISAAIFAGEPDSNRLRQIGIQALGLVIIAAISTISFTILMLILRATVGIRISEAAEQDGQDLVDHDLNAYPDFQQTMIKSYDLRQM